MGVKCCVGGRTRAVPRCRVFVKYSFDNNLISAELRVAIGFVVGSLASLPVWLLREKTIFTNPTPAQNHESTSRPLVSSAVHPHSLTRLSSLRTLSEFFTS